MNTSTVVITMIIGIITLILYKKWGEINVVSNTEPKAWADNIPVYCAHDVLEIVDMIKDLFEDVPE